MGIILAVLLFSIVVIVHEFGHFLLAKANGIRVDEFSLGLGPTLFGKVIKGTKFSLKLLPFGGACMMGEDDTEDMSEGSFNSKSVWARMSVIAAGPVFNFILAFILSTVIVVWVGYDSSVITGVTEGSPAQEQGMQAGDEIVKINGKRVHLFREVSLYNMMHQGKTTEVVYERDGQQHTVVLEPRADENGYYRLGIERSVENTRGNIFQSVQYGAYTVRYWINYTIECLKLLVGGQVGLNDLSGPVGIVSFVDDTYTAAAPSGIGVTIRSLLNIAILLSANLGVMNLLPIPALDGGRLAFLVIEAVRRKRIAPEKEGMVHFAGLVLLLLLMMVVMFNDIRKLF